jgi:3',5'-cyclic-AMP phosphodiesterase
MTVRILHVTDCHLFADPTVELKEICTRDRFNRVLAALRAELPRAERLIITGDLAHDERKETYEALRELLGEWLPRVRVVPGNHDDRQAMRETFREVVENVHGRNVFSESLGNWRLIGLDTQINGALPGEVGAPQFAWLEEQLAASPQPTVLFLHHPPVSVGSAWLDRIGLTDAAALWNLLDRFPQVRVLCSGHVHQELAIQRGGVLVLTTPSTGVQFVPEAETLIVDDGLPGYRVLELQDDGGVRTRVVRVLLPTP